MHLHVTSEMIDIIIDQLNKALKRAEVGTLPDARKAVSAISGKDGVGPIGHSIRTAIISIEKIPKSEDREIAVGQARSDIQKVRMAFRQVASKKG